ncbi:MAG: DUF2845 domain-containing protein [Woeseiaceae bacterium]|nr:DUF2845 domain-containing protein [Woeseiaceae bacterium]
MKLQILKIAIVLALLAVALPGAANAESFRCGTKLVKEGMHETEVVAICGEPTSMRNIGFAVRLIDYRTGRPHLPGLNLASSPGHVLYPAEVMVTEYVYNLGPRKFMRRLVFEGGLLARVETLGRGYTE